MYDTYPRQTGETKKSRRPQHCFRGKLSSAEKKRREGAGTKIYQFESLKEYDVRWERYRNTDTRGGISMLKRALHTVSTVASVAKGSRLYTGRDTFLKV